MSRKVILFCIAFLLLIVVVYMQIKKPPPEVAERETISVVVAKHDLPPFTVLSLEDVRTEQLDPALVPDTFGGLREPVGLMTTTEVRAGSPVHRSEVLTPDVNWREGQMLIFSFYVPTSRIVGGQLRPGHHIDLLATRGETRELPAESMWLAQNLWVVGVYQSSGEDVPRPPVGLPQSEESEEPAGGTLSFAQAGGDRGVREGPANLVVVAATRETGKVIGDYLGARFYEAWVYVRPGTLGGEAMEATGRVDGVVFEDRNLDLIQERNEPGLDNVRITLYNESNTELGIVVTESGGKFQFANLEPGLYYLEEQDPEGYISVTPNRLRLEIANGLNLHVIFGDQVPATPEETTKKVTEVPAATPTPAPAKVVTKAVEQIVSKVCGCSVYMSTEEDGVPTSNFAPEDTVWAVIEFKDCPKDMAYSVRILYSGTGAEERVNGSLTWPGGSGKRSVQVMPWMGDKSQFAAGTYTTFIKVGPENVVYDYAQWTVGGTGGPVSGDGQQTDYPTTGGESGSTFGYRRK